MRRLGIGVIGAGRPNIATQQHLSALRLVPEARLVALHDVDEEGVRRYAAEEGVEGYTDLEEMLKREDLEAVIVASPDMFHAEHTVMAARAGKHVLCQKPVALSLVEARAIELAVRESRVVFSAAQSMRYEAAARRAKEIIESGEIGEPVYACFSVKGRFFPYPPNSPYRKKETLGQFAHNGMHYVDLLAFLLGSLPVRVFAMSRAHYPTEDKMETANHTVALLDFESGAMGRVEQNLTMIEPAGFPQRSETRVIGRKGMLVFGTGREAALEVFDQGGFSVAQPEVVAKEEEAFVLLTRDFVGAVLEGREAAVSMGWAMRVLEACLGAVESCETGGTAGIHRM